MRSSVWEARRGVPASRSALAATRNKVWVVFTDGFIIIVLSFCVYLFGYWKLASRRDLVAHPLTGLLEPFLRRFIGFLEAAFDAVQVDSVAFLASSSCLFNWAV